MTAMPPFEALKARHYGALLVDPPWHFRAWSREQRSNWGSRRDAERFYPILGIDDICALPVHDLAAPDCHLFLWVTGPCLLLASRIIDAWGFRYSGVAFTWVKLRRRHDPAQLRFLPTADSDLHVGLGFTTRKNTEFCLLARRGNAKRQARDVREVILSPVREHSRKPAEAHDRIERYCAGPYAELFAREQREGWDCWGNQTGYFARAA